MLTENYQKEMIRDIARQIKSTCEFMSFTEIIGMLKYFQSNKSHLILEQKNFRMRKIINYQTDSSGEVIVETLQMQCFDKKSNQKKIIEVILADSVTYGIEQLVYHVDQCKQQIRTDFIFEIYDSYFLDEFELFYVIEYEYFEPYCMSKEEEEQDSKFLNDMSYLIQYFALSISPSPSFLKCSNSLCYLFQIGLTDQVGSPNSQLKFNLFDPYIFQQPLELNSKPPISIINEEKDINALSKSFTPLDFMKNYQDFVIHKDRLIKFLQEQYPKIYDLHGEAISKMISTQQNYINYFLLKFDESYIELLAETDQQIALNEEPRIFPPSLRIKLIKCQTPTIAQELIKNYEKSLELKNIQSVIEKCEILSLSTCQYIFSVINQEEFNGCQSVAYLLNFKYEEQFGNLFSRRYSEEQQVDCLRKITILEQLLENVHTLKQLNIGIEDLYINQKTSQWYLSDKPQAYQVIERSSLFQNNLENIYTNYIFIAIERLSFLFPSNQNCDSESYKKFIKMIQEYLSKEDLINNKEEQEDVWLELRKIIQTFKKLITINRLSKLYFKFSQRNLNSFEFLVPKEYTSSSDIEQFLQIFKENNNIISISIEGVGGGIFQSSKEEQDMLWQLQIELADTQPNLQSWKYFFKGEGNEFENFNTNPDYFNLTTKHSLNELIVFVPSFIYLKCIFLQINNNKNRINTLEINIKSMYLVVEQIPKQLYKIKGLVCLKFKN